MPWSEIFALITKLIESCTKQDGEAVVIRRMKAGGPLVRFALVRHLRQAGLRGEDLRVAVDDAMDTLRQSTDAQIEATVSQAAEGKL